MRKTGLSTVSASIIRAAASLGVCAADNAARVRSMYARRAGDHVGQKAFASALHAAVGEQIFEIVDLVAEGDAVVARFNYRVTSSTGP